MSEERISDIFQDERPIKSIWSGPTGWEVGINGITKIVAYPESGSMAAMSFFAVYKGDEIFARVSAQQYMVIYDLEKSNDTDNSNSSSD